MSPTASGRKGSLPSWVHIFIAIALLSGAATLDITKPFGKTWSIFYLLSVLYVGWALQGRIELALYAAITLSVYLVPMIFRPTMLTVGTGYTNRTLGVLLGLVVMLLLWERRRNITALEQGNTELEQRVVARTAELEGANQCLRQEIAERKSAEAAQRRLEDQLRQAQKMEAIGLLAGGVAHDFNNLLTVINGYCSMLLDKASVDPSWRPAIEEIHKAGDRAAELTRQLLAFSRKQILQPRIVNLNHSISSAENLLRRLLPENIRLRIELSPTVQPVLADPGQLVQVLLNLASNARDAMPEGGELTVRTEPVELTRWQLANLPDMPPGPYVRLLVTDTGQGMEEATRNRVFEPFFTTKEVGKGTGLGLASVYGIIKQSGGHIEVASVPGQGTTFTILMPCVRAPNSSPDRAPAPANELSPGCGTILFVEDEAQVRHFAATALRQAGYQVSEATNGQEALRLVADNEPERFDLLITDVVMPEMGGPALMKHLAPLCPGLKVLFISGYPRREGTGGLEPGELFLEKPFGAQALLAKVAELLPHPHASPLLQCHEPIPSG